MKIFSSFQSLSLSHFFFINKIKRKQKRIRRKYSKPEAPPLPRVHFRLCSTRAQLKTRTWFRLQRLKFVVVLEFHVFRSCSIVKSTSKDSGCFSIDCLILSTCSISLSLLLLACHSNELVPNQSFLFQTVSSMFVLISLKLCDYLPSFLPSLLKQIDVVDLFCLTMSADLLLFTLSLDVSFLWKKQAKWRKQIHFLFVRLFIQSLPDCLADSCLCPDRLTR